MSNRYIDFYPPGSKEVRYDLGLVCTKGESDKEKSEVMRRFLPGTPIAKRYNNLLDSADKHFGEIGVYLLGLTKPVFRLVENREYKKILKEISTQ